MVLLLKTLVKQQAMKTFFLLVSTAILLACGISKQGQNTQQPEMMPIQISQIDDGLFKQVAAPILIDSVAIDAHIATVYYTADFNPGELILIGSSLIAKSFPPIRNCKILATKNQTEKKAAKAFKGIAMFDVRPLSNKFIKDAPTYLQIEGWPEKILFIYPE